jgi:AraC-like DNA-binding protein
MPLRSLQRSLQKEGSSYQALLDQFRQQQSKKLLLTTDLSIAQIAEKLGYLNLSSYHRAFQRWYGITPAVFRKQTPH